MSRGTARVRVASLALAALPALLVGCARIEPPPGGPPDMVAPRLVSTTPDSLAVIPNFKGAVVFRFSEVISEGGSPSQGTGTGDLERLVVLSPSEKVPDVDWRRNRIAVRPRDGWRPNTVYRVELLPGVTDLRRNRGDNRAVVTFTTGAPAPNTSLTGRVIDWTSARPAPAALVSAVLLPDSLAYRAVADSSGNFKLGPLPRGQYVVYGVIDQNQNLRRDPREQFDSVRVGPDSTAVGELWTFAHDTVGPRIAMMTPNDSVSVTVAFSQPLDPRQRIKPSAVRLLMLPDSTPVRVRSLLPPEVHDSVYPRAAPPATRRPGRDSTPRDSTRRDSTLPRIGPEPSQAGDEAAAPPGGFRSGTAAGTVSSRPPLYDRLILRVAKPLTPGGRYLLEVSAVRNVNRVAADARGALAIPERPKPPPADTARGRAARDSLPRAAADSTRRPAPRDSAAVRAPAARPRRTP